MKKPKGQHIGKASSIDLSSDIPWIDFHEELKMQAGKLYSKPILDDMHNFEINYTIPRVSANPLSLDTKNDYEYMIENVINSKKKDTTIKVQICELPVSSGKENMDPNNSGSDDEPPKKRQKKGKSSDGTKTKKKSDILPRNQALVENITKLRKRWTCSLTSCPSDHCFIPPEGPHLYLGHEHVEKWAAAMLQNDGSATLNTPPNIKLFDAVSPQTLATKSPILQARLDQIALKSKAQAPMLPMVVPSTPIVNFVLPNNMFTPSFQQPMQPFNIAPTPGVTNTGPTPQPSSVTNPIIPTGYQPGPKQSIRDFCRFYSLSNGIFDKFDQNTFTGTHAFRRLNSSDLRAMNFKPGEIIDLKDAIEEWAIKIS
ncbi:hypothetical protein JOM56_015732 [Amanita muscaria]